MKYINVYKVAGKEVYIEYFENETEAKQKAADVIKEMIKKPIEEGLFVYGDSYPDEDGIITMDIMGGELEGDPLVRRNRIQTIEYDPKKTYLILGRENVGSKDLFGIKAFGSDDEAETYVKREIEKIEEEFPVCQAGSYAKEDDSETILRKKGNLQDLLTVEVVIYGEEYYEEIYYFKLF